MAEHPQFSPPWWLMRLNEKLDVQGSHCKWYENYINGLQVNWSTSTIKYQEYFRQMISSVSDNWLPMVVDAAAERLSVQGFRMGTLDNEADSDAWNIWQYNDLDLYSDALHSTVLATGVGYVQVWASGDDTAPVTISTEHPSEVYVAIDSMGNRLAGIKRWADEWTGEARANVFLPDTVYKFGKSHGDYAWKLLPDGIMHNPLMKVPIVPFYNRTNLRRGVFRSEIADVLSVQDQINKLVMDMLIASEFSAFRQRWMTGVDIPIDENGKPVEKFKAMVDRVWMLEDENVKLGEFSASDLSNYVGAIQNRIQSLASRSRTPAHYMLSSMTNISGEALKSSETGLVAKVRKHMKEYGEPWEEVMRLAFDVLDDPRSKIRNSETIWADPESRTESEHVDSLVKKISLGVPFEQLWMDAGYSPTQIERFHELLREQSLTQGLSAPLNITVGGNSLGNAASGPVNNLPRPALPSGTLTPNQVI